MSGRWWELRLNVPSLLADDAAATLFSVGACGVQLLSSETLPPPNEAFTPVSDSPEPAPAQYLELAGLIVSFQDLDDTRAVASEIIIALASVGVEVEESDFQWFERADTDWSERWREFFEPTRLGPRLWVVPSWRDEFELPAEAIALSIDPGMAFGTGQHATTALCAELIDRRMERGCRFLDVGCGSGILAIGAAKLGASSVMAIDIDPEAVEATEGNAERNGVENLIGASDTPVSDVTGKYHWVVANILAEPLKEMACDLVRRMTHDGHLLVSGILNGVQTAEITQALVEAAEQAVHAELSCIESMERAGWSALRFRFTQ